MAFLECETLLLGTAHSKEGSSSRRVSCRGLKKEVEAADEAASTAGIVEKNVRAAGRRNRRAMTVVSFLVYCCKGLEVAE